MDGKLNFENPGRDLNFDIIQMSMRQRFIFILVLWKINCDIILCFINLVTPELAPGKIMY